MQAISTYPTPFFLNFQHLQFEILKTFPFPSAMRRIAPCLALLTAAGPRRAAGAARHAALAGALARQAEVADAAEETPLLGNVRFTGGWYFC